MSVYACTSKIGRKSVVVRMELTSEQEARLLASMQQHRPLGGDKKILTKVNGWNMIYKYVNIENIPEQYWNSGKPFTVENTDEIVDWTINDWRLERMVRNEHRKGMEPVKLMLDICLPQMKAYRV